MFIIGPNFSKNLLNTTKLFNALGTFESKIWGDVVLFLESTKTGVAICF